MTSRRLIRIKTMQLLYAYSKREKITIPEAERELLKSLEQSKLLLLTNLDLLTELRHFAYSKMEAGKARKSLTGKKVVFDSHLIDNKVITLIQNNKEFLREIMNNSINWNDNQELISSLYSKILASQCYKEYSAIEKPTFDDDKHFIQELLSSLIACDEFYLQTIEDRSIYWNDDMELILGLEYRIIKAIAPDSDADTKILLDIYKGDDYDFAKSLLRRTLLENAENIKLINDFATNWEVERISEIDRVILSEAITEIRTFPSIPIKVTLNEYIELAKNYSSEKSGPFINGILDKIVSQMKTKGEINKTGRGLMQ